MKNILITGANSYIGTSFEKYITDNFPDNYVIDTVDMIDGSWREKSFAGYDVIFHVAGIAHSDTGNISQEKEKLYYKVNTDLSIETALKAKCEGVKQFIYMSSAIVYGDSAPIGECKIITKDTIPTPVNCYGESKLRAENGILKLQGDDFKVVVLRSPMIYGKGCKGNFVVLSKIAKLLPIFPYVNNKRSMLYIENLCEFVRLMIKNEEIGIFWPQNNEYSNTSELVKLIANVCGKRMILVRGFCGLLKLMSFFVVNINKAFGSFCYEKSISKYKDNYCIYSLEESIYKT